MATGDSASLHVDQGAWTDLDAEVLPPLGLKPARRGDGRPEGSPQPP